MVVRIHNASKWSRLEVGHMLELPGTDEVRKVRLEVNCPAPTRLDVIIADKPVFLAVVQGYEVVEFSAAGTVVLSADSESDVFYFTNDGDQIAVDRPLAVSFAKVATRRARNPELEMMMFKAEQNIQRRLAAQQEEFEAMREARRLEAEAQGADGETGEVNADDDDQGAGGEDSGGGAGAAGAPGAAASGKGASA